MTMSHSLFAKHVKLSKHGCLGAWQCLYAARRNCVTRAAAQQACTQEAAVTGVVRGVLMTRPGADGAHGGTLQELVRRLPGELFRTCLARVPPLTPCQGIT